MSGEFLVHVSFDERLVHAKVVGADHPTPQLESIFIEQLLAFRALRFQGAFVHGILAVVHEGLNVVD